MVSRSKKNRPERSETPSSNRWAGRAPGPAAMLVPLLCLAVAGLIVACVRMLPARTGAADLGWLGDSASAGVAEDYRYPGGDGREYVYLGGYDGYAWAHLARKLLETGSVCDQVVDGVCMDRTGLAPDGRSVRYPRSVHVRAIAALHRALAWLSPGRPLLASAFLVPVLVAVLAVVPAFAIGFRLTGVFGGCVAALLSGLHPVLLLRSFGADNDIWNFFFPAMLAWLAIEAILARSRLTATVLAAVAGLLVGPYALTWNGWPFAWSIVVAGLAVNAVLVLAADRFGRPDRYVRPRDALATLAAFVVAAGVATTLAGASVDYLDATEVLFDSPFFASVAFAEGGARLGWPDNYAAVGELRALSLPQVATWIGGPVYLLVAWMGVVLMLVPSRAWAPYHFAVFLSGVALFRLLFALPDHSPLPMVAALSLPLVAAVVLYAADAREGARRRASVSIVVWFLASLYLGLGAIRFLLLLVLPFAVAVAVAADRLLGLAASFDRRSDGRRCGVLAIATGLVLCAVMFAPLRSGVVRAQAYRPEMNRAWDEVLSQVRDGSAADSIVTTWWPAGYFASYFSRRRVSADGGVLHSGAPYWLARAMMSEDERQTVGFLRMLHCGSLARRDLGDFGQTFGQLGRFGLSPLEILHLIERVAIEDAATAERSYAEQGIPSGFIVNLMEASHCRVPESYLVLSSRNRQDRSWQEMAVWDLAAKTGAAERATSLARVRATNWGSCAGDGESRECSVPWRRVAGLDLRLDRPVQSRLRGGNDWGPPDLVLRAGAEGVEMLRGGDDGAGWSVLYDSTARRAAIGPTSTVRSTYSQLTLLDGRYSRFFEKVGEATAAGNRISAWRVRWDRAGGSR